MKLLTRQEELLMLAVFNIEEDASLASIREYLIEHAEKDWAFGSIYMSLEKLCKRGLMETRMGNPSPTRGGKAIKTYRLTREGIELLKTTKNLQDRLWRKFTRATVGI